METEYDPRKTIHVLHLAEGQGAVTIHAPAIKSVERNGLATIKVAISGHMTLYVSDEPGLYSELLRSMAAVAEYADAKAELAGEAIQ